MNHNKRYNLIISNPPYIPISDVQNLDSNVILYDPLSSLTDFDDGLSFYKYFSKIGPTLLLDGGLNPNININKKIIIKGDNISISIAAASIVAKVTRDKLMEKFDQSIHGYKFAKHKGYLTKLHKERLQELGPSNIHRKSFYPVTEFFK